MSSTDRRHIKDLSFDQLQPIILGEDAGPSHLTVLQHREAMSGVPHRPWNPSPHPDNSTHLESIAASVGSLFRCAVTTQQASGDMELSTIWYHNSAADENELLSRVPIWRQPTEHLQTVNKPLGFGLWAVRRFRHGRQEEIDV